VASSKTAATHGLAVRDLDLLAVAVGASVSALAAIGLAVAGAAYGRSTDGGATAAAVSEGLGELSGAAIGLFLCSALTALLARRGSRVLAGVCASLLAFGLVLLPVLLVTRPGGSSVRDELLVDLSALVLFGPIAFVGGTLGLLVRDLVDRSRNARGRQAGSP
jgi:hypothetical protein